MLSVGERMKKFIVETVWSGYCRGVAKYEVEAETAEEAEENWYDGVEIERYVVRDDTESDVVEVKEVKNDSDKNDTENS